MRRLVFELDPVWPLRKWWRYEETRETRLGTEWFTIADGYLSHWTALTPGMIAFVREQAIIMSTPRSL